MNKTDLLNILNQVKFGLSSKNNIEQSDCIIFEQDKVFTFNGELNILYKFDTVLPIQGALNGNKFTSVVEKFKNDNINIEDKKDKVILKNDNIKVQFKKESDIKLGIPIDISTIKGWKKIPENFMEALKTVSFSASKDPSDNILTQLLIKDNNIISCDRFRLTKYILTENMNEFLLSSSLANKILNFQLTDYVVTDNWICFRGENIYINCLRVIEDYPNVDHLFNVEGTQIDFPVETRKSIENVSILATAESEEDKYIDIICDENKLTIKGGGIYGSIEEMMESEELKNISFNIKVHPVYIKQILMYTNKVIIGEDKLLFEGNNFKHVLSLVVENE